MQEEWFFGSAMSSDKKIERARRELEEEEDELKRDFVNHGVGLGVKEYQHVGEHHPVLRRFFEEADEVLNLDRKDQERLSLLGQKFLTAELAADELDELETKYFIPYFRAIMKQKQKSRYQKSSE